MTTTQLVRRTALLAAAAAGIGLVAGTAPASADTRTPIPTVLGPAEATVFSANGSETLIGGSLHRMSPYGQKLPIAGATLVVKHHTALGTAGTCTAVTDSAGVGVCYSGSIFWYWGGTMEVQFRGTASYAPSSITYSS